jgi:hypothetical protein
MRVSLRRRELLLFGLSATFVAAIPEVAFADDFSSFEKSDIGPGASLTRVYKHDVRGKISLDSQAALSAFATTAIGAWGFTNAQGRTDISQYTDVALPVLLSLKTDTQGADSYLAEYESGAKIWSDALLRFGDTGAAFAHVMFAGRPVKDLNAPRLIRARQFVFDEFVRHLISRGGFGIFGFTNFEGFQGGPPDAEGTYRRSKV